MRALHHPFPNRQQGAAVVEFAAVVIVLFILLIAIFEFGRLMFTWNSAVEATRRGARLAVVCDLNVTQIKTQMRSILPVVEVGDIDIAYRPSGCSADSCQTVTVKILPQSDTAARYFLPLYISPSPATKAVGEIKIINTVWKIPEFSTTLTRESLSNGTGTGTGTDDTNPDCFPPP